MEVLLILSLKSMLVIAAYNQQIVFSEYKRLYEHIKENAYNNIRPVINQSKSVNIDMTVNLQTVQKLDEKEQLLHSTITLICRWKYETLAWNESEFSGIKSLYVSPEYVWIPDLIVSNAKDSLLVLMENRPSMVQIRVESNGDAIWHTGGNFRTSCSIDITMYPFDVQKCTIIIAKSTPDSEVLFSSSSDQVLLALYRENGEWGLENSMIVARVVYQYITFIDINLTLKRFSLFYVLNIIVPVTLLSFMIVLSFKIPAASGERLSYCIALLLTFVVLLNLVSDSMPRVPKHVSYLQLFIIYQLTVAVIITSLSILLARITHTGNNVHISGIIKYLYRWYSFKMSKKVIQSNPRESKEVIENEEKSIELHNDSSDKQQSEQENDHIKCTQFVVQHVDQSLFLVFMGMFFISTILVLFLIAT